MLADELQVLTDMRNLKLPGEFTHIPLITSNYVWQFWMESKHAYCVTKSAST